MINEQEIKRLFSKLQNIQTGTTTGGNAGSRIWLKLPQNQVQATCIKDVDPGDCLGIKADDGQWYVTQASPASGEERSRRQISYRRCEQQKDPQGSLVLLTGKREDGQLQVSVYSENKLLRHLDIFPPGTENTFRLSSQGYIHNYGKGIYQVSFTRAGIQLGGSGNNAGEIVGYIGKDSKIIQEHRAEYDVINPTYVLYYVGQGKWIHLNYGASVIANGGSTNVGKTPVIILGTQKFIYTFDTTYNVNNLRTNIYTWNKKTEEEPQSLTISTTTLGNYSQSLTFTADEEQPTSYKSPGTLSNGSGGVNREGYYIFHDFGNPKAKVISEIYQFYPISENHSYSSNAGDARVFDSNINDYVIAAHDDFTGSINQTVENPLGIGTYTQNYRFQFEDADGNNNSLEVSTNISEKNYINFWGNGYIYGSTDESRNLVSFNSGVGNLFFNSSTDRTSNLYFVSNKTGEEIEINTDIGLILESEFDSDFEITEDIESFSFKTSFIRSSLISTSDDLAVFVGQKIRLSATETFEEDSDCWLCEGVLESISISNADNPFNSTSTTHTQITVSGSVSRVRKLPFLQTAPRPLGGDFKPVALLVDNGSWFSYYNSTRASNSGGFSGFGGRLLGKDSRYVPNNRTHPWGVWGREVPPAPRDGMRPIRGAINNTSNSENPRILQYDNLVKNKIYRSTFIRRKKKVMVEVWEVKRIQKNEDEPPEIKIFFTGEIFFIKVKNTEKMDSVYSVSYHPG